MIRTARHSRPWCSMMYPGRTALPLIFIAIQGEQWLSWARTYISLGRGRKCGSAERRGRRPPHQPALLDLDGLELEPAERVLVEAGHALARDVAVGAVVEVDHHHVVGCDLLQLVVDRPPLGVVALGPRLGDQVGGLLVLVAGPE